MPLTVDETHFTNPPASLADVIGQVKDAFQTFGDATPIMVGRKFLERGPGSAPRVVFAPEPAGSVGPAIVRGRPVSIRHTCVIYIRGRESGDDLTRYKNTEKLADLVIDLVQTAGAGRIEWGAYEDNSPTDSDAFGAEISVLFSYQRDVLHSEKRWPPGAPGVLHKIDATTLPKNGD